MVSLRRSLSVIAILINGILLVLGYYFLVLLRNHISAIGSSSSVSSYEVWGSMLYIAIVLMLVALIIQAVIYSLKIVAIKLGFETEWIVHLLFWASLMREFLVVTKTHVCKSPWPECFNIMLYGQWCRSKMPFQNVYSCETNSYDEVRFFNCTWSSWCAERPDLKDEGSVFSMGEENW